MTFLRVPHLPDGISKMQQFRSAGIPMEDLVMGCCTALSWELRDMACPIPREEFTHDASL